MQDLLKKQVEALNTVMENFKMKENLSDNEIKEHNDNISEIQRRIHIIYERCHTHVTNITSEYGKLLNGIDEFKKKYNNK